MLYYILWIRLISIIKMRFSYMFSLKILGYGRNGLVLISIFTYALCASIYQNVYTKTIILYIYCIMYKHTVVSINTQIRIQKLLCIGVVNTLCCLLLRKHAKYYSNAFFVFSNTNNLFIFVVSAKTGILLKNWKIQNF